MAIFKAKLVTVWSNLVLLMLSLHVFCINLRNFA